MTTLCTKKDCSNPSKFRCSHCKVISYCTKECQKSDWKDHKPTCKDIFLKKEKNLNALFDALSDSDNKFDVISSLLNLSAEELDINDPGRQGITALTFACSRGNIKNNEEIVKLMLKRNGTDYNKCTNGMFFF